MEESPCEGGEKCGGMRGEENLRSRGVEPHRIRHPAVELELEVAKNGGHDGDEKQRSPVLFEFGDSFIVSRAKIGGKTTKERFREAGLAI